MKRHICLVATVLVAMVGVCFPVVYNRYPVGQPVPASVYTEPFDPCDPAYKFFQIQYGDPNNPKWQAAPDDWIKRFGNNERTMHLQATSELRVVVANLAKLVAEQGKRIAALEDWQKKQPVWEVTPGGEWLIKHPDKPKDPNEAKK